MLSEFEKQVLKNQSTLLLCLIDISENNKLDDETLTNVSSRMRESLLILTPPSLAESKALDDERNDLMGNKVVKLKCKKCGKETLWDENGLCEKCGITEELKWKVFKGSDGGYMVFRLDLPANETRYVKTREEAIKLRRDLNDALTEVSENA